MDIKEDKIHPASEQGDPEILKVSGEDNFEVFKKTEGGVEFRNMGWLRACVIFVKVQFALGVLNLPLALYTLGALPGAILIVAWGVFNTYTAIVLGNFRNRHPGIHTVADMAYLVGGLWFREVVGFLFILGNVLCVSATLVGMSTGINALSHHAACTVWWGFISMVAVAVGSSMRKLHSIGWLTWVGFICLYIAVLIVVIAVTVVDRPAAAPQEGDFDLGYHVIGHPGFVAGLSTAATIFVSSAGSSTFVPVIAEMRNPLDFKKSVYVGSFVIHSSYLTFSLVVYRWCGMWVASPSLGSAGQTVKMVSYAIAMVGLLASAVVYLHVASKYMFVRLLRDSKHLQANTVVHWSVWLGTTFGLCIISWILAEAVPILNYLLSLMSGVCYAPLSIMLPGLFWLYDHREWRKASALKQGGWVFHIFVVLLGAFFCVSATYTTITQIIDAYAVGQIGSAFSCADNSNSS